jgi:hypothetical protein
MLGQFWTLGDQGQQKAGRKYGESFHTNSSEKSNGTQYIIRFEFLPEQGSAEMLQHDFWLGRTVLRRVLSKTSDEGVGWKHREDGAEKG